MPPPTTPHLLSELRRIAALPLEECTHSRRRCSPTRALRHSRTSAFFAGLGSASGARTKSPNPATIRPTISRAIPSSSSADADGQIRAFPNICRHRAARLLEGTGNAKRIVCPYHAWTYDLEGKLVSALFMSESFKPEKVCLPALRTEVWEGFVYVNPDPDAAPLGPQLARLSQRFHNHRLADYQTVLRVEETWPANWKILFENFSEPYHSFIAHRTTVDPALPTRLTRHDEAGDDAWTIYTQVRPPGVTYEYGAEMRVLNDALTEQRARRVSDLRGVSRRISARSRRSGCSGFRSVRAGPGMCGYAGGSMRIRDRCRRATPARSASANARASFDKINGEDRGIISALQANASSRYAMPGRLSPKENCIWEFQRYLARQLA